MKTKHLKRLRRYWSVTYWSNGKIMLINHLTKEVRNFNTTREVVEWYAYTIGVWFTKTGDYSERRKRLEYYKAVRLVKAETNVGYSRTAALKNVVMYINDKDYHEEIHIRNRAITFKNAKHGLTILGA